MQLKGKNIFITGGTGGIGRPLVTLLKKEGAIVTVYNRERQGALPEHLDYLCAALSETTPDILINMAGYNEFSYCEDQNAQGMIELNLLTPIRLTQSVLPTMKARGAGQIVNVGSMTGLIPLPHLTVYSATKAGLKAFSDSLRRELAGTRISVSHITPRAVNTSANSRKVIDLNQKTGTHHDEPNKVAARILQAILKREADVRIGWPERFFAILNSVFPSLVDGGLKKNRVIAEQILNS